MLEASNQDGTGAASPRRITANSFKALQARLAGKACVAPPAPRIADPMPVAATAPPVEQTFDPPAARFEPIAAPAEAIDIVAATAAPAPSDWRTEAAAAIAEIAPQPIIVEEQPHAPFEAPQLRSAPWAEAPEIDGPAPAEPAPVMATEPAPVHADANLEWAKRAFTEIAEETSLPPTAARPEAPEAPAETIAPPRPREPQILRRPQPIDDPFADAVALGEPDEEAPLPVIIEEPDSQAGDVARSLIDIMASSAGTSQPQERALAADTLLQLVPRIPAKELAQIADRVAKMDNPPQLLVSRIIRDPRPDVASALLERAGNIPDQELLTVAAENNATKLRMIARRRSVSTALADAIVNSGDASALLTLVRNPGASISHDAFQTLCEMARHTPSLQAPLATRADIPPVVAFQMFWLLPAELRRYILSRFLTDSETLNRILKITMAVDGGEAGMESSEAKFPDANDVESVLTLAAEGNLDGAARRLAEIDGICAETGRRILADSEGEPLAVLLKSLGLSRTRFAEALERLAPLLRADRNPHDLQGIFDQLSFNKARMLLTYWDWAAQQTGPYAKRAA